MADTKDPSGNFAPKQQRENTDFVRSFPTYEKCDVIGAGADAFNMSMLTRVGVNRAKWKEADGTGKPGNKRLDIQKYRCLLLTRKIPELGYRRVLDAPNYLDCRVDPPPNVSVIINDAIKAFGQGDRYNADTITRILQDIDDQMEDNPSAKESLGALASVINALANFPQQGTDARIFLESSMELLFETIQNLKDILKKAFSAVGDYADNIINIVLTFVDMLFFVGDYLTEHRNLRNELAARLLSQQRSIGLGDKKGVYGAYKVTYGAGPSMQTIRAWCKAGEARQPQDLFLLPDGTSGAYNDALAKWKATREILTLAVPKLEDLFKNDYTRFFGLCFFIGAFRKVYSVGGDDSEFAYYIGVKGKHEESVLRKAVKFGNSSPAVVELYDVSSLPYSAEIQASTRVEAAGCWAPDFWVPFWEDTVLGNYNNDVNTETPAETRRSLRSKLRDYMFAKWATANGPFKCKAPYSDKQYFTYAGASVEKFATQVLSIYDFFEEWGKKAYPSYGSIRRGREIDKLLGNRIDLFYTYAMGGVPEGMDWTKAVLTAFLPSEEVTQFGVTTKIDLGPEPRPEQFPGVKARCPGGEGDTSCLPCGTIRNRRPVGAKAIAIPTLIKWSGERGPRKSPEFAAWAENLRQNGYPEYYIDCIAQDVAFEALPGASSKRENESSGWKFRLPGQVVPVVTANVPLLSIRTDLLQPKTAGGSAAANLRKNLNLSGMGGSNVIGISAPRVATLNGAPPAARAKRLAAKAGYLTISQRRMRGLIPVGKSGQLKGVDSPDSSSSKAKWIIGGLVVAGAVYAAYRHSKK